MAERTDKDYVIEHAGYMADAARHLMQCMDHEFDASEALEAAEAADAENAAEKAEDLSSIQQDLVEARSVLSNRIYEFEKRRDHALRTPLQHPSTRPSSVEGGELALRLADLANTSTDLKGDLWKVIYELRGADGVKEVGRG